MSSIQSLLITGGTGTFGNAVTGRVATNCYSEIRIFSRDEKKQDDMRRRWADPRIKFYIGDVRNEQSLIDAMAGVDVVFHAAALKQVPSCEFFPIEAVRTNALGTENVLNAAIAAGVKRVIVLSTDKAVYPINAMGISKALMEKLAVAKSRVAGTAPPSAAPAMATSWPAAARLCHCLSDRFRRGSRSLSPTRR